MNPIHQSLSSLLQNPALQSDAGARRPGARPAAGAPGGESLEVSDAARQSLARSNAAAVLPVVSDLAEAQDLTRLLRTALTGGGIAPDQLHGSLDPRTVGSLLR